MSVVLTDAPEPQPAPATLRPLRRAAAAAARWWCRTFHPNVINWTVSSRGYRYQCANCHRWTERAWTNQPDAKMLGKDRK